MDTSTWNEVDSRFKEGLLIGNGGSIAFSDAFKYNSLFEEAQNLDLIDDEIKHVFNYLGTSDFEYVLRMLGHAGRINETLGDPSTLTEEAYENVKVALAKTLQKTHAEYPSVVDNFSKAANFMLQFSTVASLSYDLLIYWAFTKYCADTKQTHRFKDCFINGTFSTDWTNLRKPYGPCDKATIVVYPHGNICLITDLSGKETKLYAQEESGLLEEINAQWDRKKAIPLFISEGTAGQKKRAISRSGYLSAVYNEVLPNMGKGVTILGCSLDESDLHLLDAICSGSCEGIAFGLNPEKSDDSETRGRICREIESRTKNREPIEVVFFDYRSEGCWLSE